MWFFKEYLIDNNMVIYGLIYVVFTLHIFVIIFNNDIF